MNTLYLCLSIEGLASGSSTVKGIQLYWPNLITLMMGYNALGLVRVLCSELCAEKTFRLDVHKIQKLFMAKYSSVDDQQELMIVSSAVVN
jgi:hypothetical protein